MSDESTPTPLRLKPRVRPDTEPASPPAAPVPAAESNTSAPGNEAPKLRLKPKLAPATTEPATAPSDPATPHIPGAAPAPASSSIRLKPRMAAEPAVVSAEPAGPAPGAAPSSPEGAEPLQFRLKVAPPGVPTESAVPATIPAVAAAPVIPPPAAAPAADVPPPVPTAKTALPSPFPLVAGQGAQPGKLPPPVPHVRAPSTFRDTQLAAKAARSNRHSPFKSIALGAAAIVALAGGFVVFRTMRPTPPPAAANATKTAGHPAAERVPTTAAAAKAGPTPSATLNQIAAAPGHAVAKAQSVVTGRRTSEQVRVDSLAVGNEPPEQRALNTPPPSRLAPAPAAPPTTVSTAQVSPGVVATSVSTSEVIGNGGAAFRAWVEGARVNGVFQGSAPRALINGRTSRVGQIVDEGLGIVLAGVDVEHRALIFRDPTGATLSKRY